MRRGLTEQEKDIITECRKMGVIKRIDMPNVIYYQLLDEPLQNTCDAQIITDMLKKCRTNAKRYSKIVERLNEMI